VLADSWFSAQENLSFVRQDLGKHFIVALKSNQTVALSLDDKKQGRFVRIDQLDWPEQKPIQAWLKGLDFPVLTSRQVFTNKDGSTGILIWPVATSTATQRVKTQGNPVFLSIYAAFRLECLSIKHKLNPFALRAKLYLKANRLAFDELQTLECT
jgi:hypothetical protein